jgi:hypothetical protein
MEYGMANQEEEEGDAGHLYNATVSALARYVLNLPLGSLAETRFTRRHGFLEPIISNAVIKF